jgi:hypothetical protein
MDDKSPAGTLNQEVRFGCVIRRLVVGRVYNCSMFLSMRDAEYWDLGCDLKPFLVTHCTRTTNNHSQFSH